MKNIAGIKFPPASSSSAVANFNPTPVLVTTPMIIPAVAQATNTPKIPLAPLISPSTICQGVMRVDFFNIDAPIAKTIATKAARIGV